MSARQSPPNPRATARSSSTLAGSWVANGLRHGANACDRGPDHGSGHEVRL
jgi:hypothetical protein